jgi:hypothetical protein
LQQINNVGNHFLSAFYNITPPKFIFVAFFVKTMYIGLNSLTNLRENNIRSSDVVGSSSGKHFANLAQQYAFVVRHIFPPVAYFI